MKKKIFYIFIICIFVVLLLTGCTMNLKPEKITETFTSNNYDVQVLTFEESKNLIDPYTNIIPKLTMICTNFNICEKAIIFYFEDEKTANTESEKISKYFKTFFTKPVFIKTENHTVCIATKQAFELFTC